MYVNHRAACWVFIEGSDLPTYRADYSTLLQQKFDTCHEIHVLLCQHN